MVFDMMEKLIHKLAFELHKLLYKLVFDMMELIENNMALVLHQLAYMIALVRRS